MIRNYLKIAVRNLVRNKTYTVINILGLTTGITCAALLILFINDELNFDQFHTKSERIYRVVEVDESAEAVRHYGQTAPALGPALVTDYPEVSNVTRLFRPMGHINTKWQGERIAERGYYLAESNFFEIFDFELLQGDKQTALADPNTIVLTQSTAIKYFGDEDPIGQQIEFDNLSPVTVTAVVKNPPGNSHMQFDMLLGYNTAFNAGDRWQQFIISWDNFGAYTYILLDHNTALDRLNKKIPEFIEKYWGSLPHRTKFYLQPISDIYLGSADIEFGVETVHGEQFYIYLFSAIAAFLIIIASINYMNLATAKSLQRSKEIGIRKVSGAQKGQLIFQFLSESILIALLSFALSLGLIDLLMPYFNELSGKTFTFDWLTIKDYILLLFGLAIIIGLISGSYPAFYLSRLQPSESLKGDIKTKSSGYLVRQTLVIAQFAISILMIVATLIVYQQMQYIQSKEIGFRKEQMLVVDINNGDVRANFQSMKTELLKISNVEKVATSSRVPGEWKSIVERFIRPTSEELDSINAYFMAFDEDALETFEMKLITGENFSGNPLVDSTKIFINQTAADQLGFENPIGQELRVSNEETRFTIIGVINDFHFQSLHQDVAPMFIGSWNNPIQSIDYFTLKINPDNLQETIAEVTNVHESFDNRTPIEYHFLDSQLERFYEADLRAGNLFAIGAGLTIIIACLGLFGLASFTIQRKLKEISIRKVLGATAIQLFMLLSKTFAKQVLIAFIIIVPVAYLIMNKWLDYFAYKIGLNPLIFLMAGIAAFVVAIGTVSFRTIKASLLNPADTLKTE